jgi:hypothetical protein
MMVSCLACSLTLKVEELQYSTNMLNFNRIHNVIFQKVELFREYPVISFICLFT